MRFPAQVSASIEIIDTFLKTHDPIDRVLLRWSKGNRYAGSSDRRVIANMVYEGLRNKRSLAWSVGGTEDGFYIMLGYCLRHGHTIADVFCGEGYAPEQLTREINTLPIEQAPYSVRYDIPDWVPTTVADSDLECLANHERAAIDLRVNMQKASLVQAQKNAE